MNNNKLWQAVRERLTLPADDLLRQAIYRRLWTSILVSSLGGQVTMLALPLTAAVLLHATPTQMGLLTAMEIAPFVLFSLPSGVWLDRVRKLPVYIAGETALAFIVASGPLAWALGWLTRRGSTWSVLRSAPCSPPPAVRRRSCSPRWWRASGWWKRTRRTRWRVRAPRSSARAWPACSSVRWVRLWRCWSMP